MASRILLSLLLVGCAPPGLDADGDGVSDELDCAPDDPERAPILDDPLGDGIDQNCDGADGVDADGDGFVADGDLDCDDSDPTVHPGAEELSLDGLDQDCDGSDLAIARVVEEGEDTADLPVGDDSGSPLPSTPTDWPDGSYTPLGTLPSYGTTVLATGRIHSFEPSLGWLGGDVDGWRIQVASPTVLHVELDWTSPGTNLDLVAWCRWGVEWELAVFFPITWDVTQPEEGALVSVGSSSALPLNSECGLVVLGRDGQPTDYTLAITALSPSG